MLSVTNKGIVIVFNRGESMDSRTIWAGFFEVADISNKNKGKCI